MFASLATELIYRLQIHSSHFRRCSFSKNWTNTHWTGAGSNKVNSRRRGWGDWSWKWSSLTQSSQVFILTSDQNSITSWIQLKQSGEEEDHFREMPLKMVNDISASVSLRYHNCFWNNLSCRKQQSSQAAAQQCTSNAAVAAILKDIGILTISGISSTGPS